MKANERFRRPLSVLMAFLLLLSLLPAGVLAGETGEITVYVTVSDQGTLAIGTDAGKTVMANVPVTVAPDSSGKATVDAVLTTLHETYTRCAFSCRTAARKPLSCPFPCRGIPGTTATRAA